MFDESAQLQYHVFKDYDIIFDEKGASCGTVRKIQWVKGDKEPDEAKAKIEIRRITVDDSGEKRLKGYAFATPEGPNELICGMIEKGFGDTKDILKAVRKRDDFLEAATSINEDTEYNDGEVFDMRDLLLGLEGEEEEDEVINE